MAQGTRSTMFPLSARCALIGRLCGTLPPPHESTYRGAGQCEGVVSRSVVSVMFRGAGAADRATPSTPVPSLLL